MRRITANCVLFFVFVLFSAINCQHFQKILSGVQVAQKKYGQSYVNWQFYEKVYMPAQEFQKSVIFFLRATEESRVKRKHYLNSCVGALEKKERDERWQKIESPKIERKIKEARDGFEKQKKIEADERKRVADDPDQMRIRNEHIALADTLKSYMDAPWYFSWTIYLPAIWWYTTRCRAKQKEMRV